MRIYNYWCFKSNQFTINKMIIFWHNLFYFDAKKNERLEIQNCIYNEKLHKTTIDCFWEITAKQWKFFIAFTVYYLDTNN